MSASLTQLCELAHESLAPGQSLPLSCQLRTHSLFPTSGPLHCFEYYYPRSWLLSLLRLSAQTHLLQTFLTTLDMSTSPGDCPFVTSMAEIKMFQKDTCVS